MSRTIGAVTILGTLGAAGCGDKNTIVTSLAPSDFPGTSVADNFLSDDGQAFTNNSTDLNGQPLVFRNVSNNDAIIVFEVDHSDGSGSSALFASFYNGSTLTPPVAILGQDENAQSNAYSINVLFLETSAFQGTSGAARTAGRGRDGDAIITYVATDVDDVSSSAAVDRDANGRVYATYFDRSAATKAAAGTVIHGFDTLSHAIDFDGVVTGTFNDPDAGAVGFISDSLHGTHAFDSGSGVLSGDPTSFVQIAFRKSPSVGTTNVEDRWFAIPFDLGQTGNAIVAQPGVTSGLLAPAVGTLEDGDSTSNRLVVADGYALWTANGVDTNGVDNILTATAYSPTTTVALNLGSDSTTNTDNTTLPAAGNVYGPDHGIDGLLAVFTESGFSNGMTGQRAVDTDLMVAQIDAGATSRTIVEADAFRDLTDVANADGDMAGIFPLPTRNGNGGNVSQFETRINKDGTAIAISIAQPTDDRQDLNDAAVGGATVGLPATNITRYLQVVQLGRPAASLSTSILPTPLLKVAARDSTGDGTTGNGVTQRPVSNFNFQVGIGNADAAVDGGENEIENSWQSNSNRFWFTYTQRANVAAGGTVPNENRLFVDGITVTLGADVAAPTAALIHGTEPTAAVTLASTSPGSGMDINWGGFQARVIDRGVTTGEALTFFLANDNHVPDSSVMGSYEASRLYVWDGTTSSLVSSAGTSNYQVATAAPTLALVHGRVHAIFTELSGAPGSEEVVATRSFAANAAALVGIPALAAAPAFIDLPEAGGIEGYDVTWSTTTVAVYIEENGHVYYNQTAGDAAHYRLAGGLADPTLVDNDGSHQALQGWALYRNDGTNPLRDSFFMYGKTLDFNTGDTRGFIRIHD